MTVSGPAGMRFSVDAWDVGYGTALAIAEEDLPSSVARVETDIETPAGQWAPIPVARDIPHPSAVLFVDGVRRIDARVWIDDSAAPGDTTNASPVGGIAATASMAVCASYAAGVVCCCGHPGRRQAHLLVAEIRRGLFTTAAHATDIWTRAGTYRARHTAGRDNVPLTMTLSNALQQALAEIEVITALAARTALPHAAEHAGSAPTLSLLASHQDQVLTLPAGATLLARSDFCPVAAYQVDDHVLCVQPHPEFVEDYSAYLLEKRRALVGEERHASARAGLAQGHDGLDVARFMQAFVERRLG